MLSTASYYTAWLIYCAAALGGLSVLNRWLRGPLGASQRALLLLPLLGMALVPVRAAPAGDTWAPAIFAAAFSLLTGEHGAALTALRALFSGMALGLALGLLRLISRQLLELLDENP